jgi:hypothetical protein
MSWGLMARAILLCSLVIETCPVVEGMVEPLEWCVVNEKSDGESIEMDIFDIGSIHHHPL